MVEEGPRSSKWGPGGREAAGEAQPRRAGTSHPPSPGTASPTAWAGQGRAGQAGRPSGSRAWARGKPAVGGPDSPVGARRAVVEGSEGAGPERCPQGQAACHFLIYWADFLSPEGDGAGLVGGAR